VDYAIEMDTATLCVAVASTQWVGHSVGTLKSVMMGEATLWVQRHCVSLHPSWSAARRYSLRIAPPEATVTH
jgi:hypothetical protein